jgi:hypothetical protein
MYRGIVRPTSINDALRWHLEDKAQDWKTSSAFCQEELIHRPMNSVLNDRAACLHFIPQ